MPIGFVPEGQQIRRDQPLGSVAIADLDGMANQWAGLANHD
jgi:hypothetical protein